MTVQHFWTSLGILARPRSKSKYCSQLGSLISDPVVVQRSSWMGTADSHKDNHLGVSRRKKPPSRCGVPRQFAWICRIPTSAGVESMAGLRFFNQCMTTRPPAIISEGRSNARSAA
ncbi:hypothetical protein HGRIS_011155 [Hohenbuehelia grisea]|uniref:Uncharacterized protein n=1 Tax=Hohenbuehelia grisea TaxID=104357 RepID=A0ABR3IZ20_9AGAR